MPDLHTDLMTHMPTRPPKAFTTQTTNTNQITTSIRVSRICQSKSTSTTKPTTTKQTMCIIQGKTMGMSKHTTKWRPLRATSRLAIQETWLCLMAIKRMGLRTTWRSRMRSRPAVIRLVSLFMTRGTPFSWACCQTR